MFQKKNKEEEPVVLTTKGIQSLKEKLVKDHKNEEIDNLSIKDLKMDELIPQEYNGVIITIMDGYQTLDLPVSMEKNKFKTWRKSAGGVFSRDVLNYSRNKEHGKYVLLEGNGEKKIVRLIEDEELFMFKHLKLIKGIIKDKPYMLLKNVDNNDKLTSNGRYIKENSEHEKVEETIAIGPQVTASDTDDFESHTSSVSLFDE